MPFSFEIIRFPAASSSSSMNFEAKPNIFLSSVTLTTSSALAARRSQFSGTLIACAPAVITLARTNIADGSANFSFIDPPTLVFRLYCLMLGQLLYSALGQLDFGSCNPQCDQNLPSGRLAFGFPAMLLVLHAHNCDRQTHYAGHSPARPRKDPP